MGEYKIIDEFQVKDQHVIVLDRELDIGDYGKMLYIDGVKYTFIPNSVRQWFQLPGVHDNFAGKTVVFK